MGHSGSRVQLCAIVGRPLAFLLSFCCPVYSANPCSVEEAALCRDGRKNDCGMDRRKEEEQWRKKHQEACSTHVGNSQAWAGSLLVSLHSFDLIPE